MLSTEDFDRFQDGALGQVFSKSLILNLERMRSEANATTLNQTLYFDESAEPGETTIEVTLTLRVKQADDED
jgi:hypothetical protein